MKRNSLIALLALAVIAGAAYLLLKQDGADGGAWKSVTAAVKQSADGPARAVAAPSAQGAVRPPPVEVAVARLVQAATDLQSVGTLSSDESVIIAAEVAGRIASIGFREGESVKAGDVLVKLDDALTRAELADVEAGLRLAQSNFDRANALSRSGAGTQRARDEAQAGLDTARAAVELAKVRLDKMEIRAPFDGVVGLRSVSVGAYAQVGQALVNLEKIDQLKLDFRLPEINLRDIRVGQLVDIVVDAYPGRRFEGQVYAIDPQVDVNGRSIRIRARLANPDVLLRPGLFARVRVMGETRGQVVVVPEGAIVPRGTDNIVYSVKEGVAVESPVRLGRRNGGNVEIIEGLTAEDTVVTAGQSRLRDGLAVDIVTPSSQKPG